MKAFDEYFLTDKIKFIAGTDEAGRGPLAGPVVCAAVIFPAGVKIRGINDSKQLTEEEREALVPKIISKALACSVAAVSHTEIDRINILQASLYGMKKAICKLSIKPDLILVDGNKTFPFDVPSIPVIHGDAKSQSIAAASVLAKVARDRLMKRLCVKFPQYNWSKNKGYPTFEHIEAIKLYGAVHFHRKTFLRKILYEETNPMLEFIES
jgi:ribonuclease HII